MRIALGYQNSLRKETGNRTRVARTAETHLRLVLQKGRRSVAKAGWPVGQLICDSMLDGVSSVGESRFMNSPGSGVMRRSIRFSRGVAIVAPALFLMALAANAADGLRLTWTNNLLNISGPGIPGGSVEVWYLEAFCRSGSTHRDWKQTVIPHKTELVKVEKDGRRIRLLTRVDPNIEVTHDIRAKGDEVDFQLAVANRGSDYSDVQWFQPCMRVDRFTGLRQSNYIERSFIFTKDGLTMLDKTRRTEKALYLGGQVYVPPHIKLNDVNPRPISLDAPVNSLIGCFSADGEWVLGTAWDQTQELFQGVIVCLHNDPRIGGLQPGERKKLRGKVYVLKDDASALLKRYQSDFGR